MVKKIAVLGIIALSLTGCTSTLQDLEGIQAQHPDKIEVFQNADLFPNIELFCIHGVAYLITTRDYAPVQRAAELDKVCPKSEPR